MKNLRFSHKILLAASLVVIAAFTCFTLYNDYLQRNAIRNNLNSYLKEMGQVTASNIQNWLSGRILLVENLAQAIASDERPEAILAALQHDSMKSTFLYAYYGHNDGGYQQSPDTQLPADYDPRPRPWYQGAATASTTTLTPPYMDADSSNGLLITIARAVGSGANLRGVAAGDLKLETIARIVNSLNFGGMGYAFLVSADGTVLVHPDQNKVLKNLKEIFPAGAPPISDSLSEVKNLEGATRIVTFSPVNGLPSVQWYVGLSIDKDKAYAMLSEFRTSAILATVIAVVLIIFLLGMLIRVLLLPLTHMGAAMKDIAQGDGDLTKRLDVQSQDEFGELARAFNHFVERIHS
uniref:cache domain-containing protein n=1 Tax=Pseudomonas sp. RIT-PI-AD TaxID=3035294 RepID=UPI0021D83DF6